MNILNRGLSESEALSVALSNKSIPDIIKAATQNNYPPLWNIVEHLTFQMFGSSESVMRSLSLIFFLVTLFFIYKIGNLLFSRKTAIVATLLTLSNPLFFKAAFEGQMFTMLTSSVVASMYFFSRSFFGEGGKWIRFGYIVSTLWSLYTHHLAMFALFTHIIWWVFEILFGRRKTSFKIFKCFLIILLLYLPGIYLLYIQINNLNIKFPNKITLLEIRNAIYSYLAIGTNNKDLRLPFINVDLTQISLNLVFVILILKRWWKGIKKTIFLMLTFLGPIIIVWATSVKFVPLFENQYMLFVIPASMLLLAAARSKISIIPIILLLVCFSMIDYHYTLVMANQQTQNEVDRKIYGFTDFNPIEETSSPSYTEGR